MVVVRPDEHVRPDEGTMTLNMKYSVFVNVSGTSTQKEIFVTATGTECGIGKAVLFSIVDSEIELSYSTTYTVEGVEDKDGVSVLYRSGLTFTTESEPMRLVTFRIAGYLEKDKKVEFRMTGQELESDETYDVSLSIGSSVKHIVSMKFSASDDAWMGSALLYPLSSAELSYGVEYNVTEFSQTVLLTTTTHFFEAITVEIIPEPPRLTTLNPIVAYSDQDKKGVVSLSGIGLSGEYTVTMTRSKGLSGTETMSVSFDSSGKGTINGVLYGTPGAGEIGLKYGTIYEHMSLPTLHLLNTASISLSTAQTEEDAVEDEGEQDDGDADDFQPEIEQLEHENKNAEKQYEEMDEDAGSEQNADAKKTRMMKLLKANISTMKILTLPVLKMSKLHLTMKIRRRKMIEKAEDVDDYEEDKVKSKKSKVKSKRTRLVHQRKKESNDEENEMKENELNFEDDEEFAEAADEQAEADDQFEDDEQAEETELKVEKEEHSKHSVKSRERLKSSKLSRSSNKRHLPPLPFYGEEGVGLAQTIISSVVSAFSTTSDSRHENSSAMHLHYVPPAPTTFRTVSSIFQSQAPQINVSPITATTSAPPLVPPTTFDTRTPPLQPYPVSPRHYANSDDPITPSRSPENITLMDLQTGIRVGQGSTILMKTVLATLFSPSSVIDKNVRQKQFSEHLTNYAAALDSFSPSSTFSFAPISQNIYNRTDNPTSLFIPPSPLSTLLNLCPHEMFTLTSDDLPMVDHLLRKGYTQFNPPASALSLPFELSPPSSHSITLTLPITTTQMKKGTKEEAAGIHSLNLLHDNLIATCPYFSNILRRMRQLFVLGTSDKDQKSTVITEEVGRVEPKAFMITFEELLVGRPHTSPRFSALSGRSPTEVPNTLLHSQARFVCEPGLFYNWSVFCCKHSSGR
ncbi:hypothetical protein BLNAU_9595 [Blattamonas nauphoetae]|uniref:Uncharacterized protein n=1 Tax=Blattamonas nauphoetae TaxID=2049346 RepID=A0ABQ9XV49_9EUKA|nr:hypothetical protein BLNAU_9595 [Blattamonas nauphoetae]